MHDYAATVHKAQEATVDRAHVLASEHMDRHAAYVALARHRDGVALHWSAKELATG
jgi:ATP-dependent exoDNAse (exonuclease V) alpha subunit